RADRPLDVLIAIDTGPKSLVLELSDLAACVVIRCAAVRVIQHQSRVSANQRAEVGQSAPEYSRASGLTFESVALDRGASCRPPIRLRAHLMRLQILREGIRPREEIADPLT